MTESAKSEAPELTRAMRAEVERFGIHPELEDSRGPSIPNPLFHNLWAELTDEQIAESIIASHARAEAAEHTARSLERELIRRHPDTHERS